MKKIFNLFLSLLLLFTCFIFKNTIYAYENQEGKLPDLNNATLLMEKKDYFTINNEVNSFDHSSEHSPYGGYTLDFSENIIDNYSVFFVSITTHLYVKWLNNRGSVYFIQMTISMENLNVNTSYRPNITGYLVNAEDIRPYNEKQFPAEDFYATLFTDQNTIIVKNRQWIDMSISYEKHVHTHTNRSGWILGYKYSHFYKKENHRIDTTDTNKNSFIFRGGNSVLYNFNFSSLVRGPQNTKNTQYNRTIGDNIILYNSIGVAFTSEIALNFDDTKYINASGEFIKASNKINWNSISVSFPLGISINPTDLIQKEVKKYRSLQDLQWKVV